MAYEIYVRTEGSGEWKPCANHSGSLDGANHWEALSDADEFVTRLQRSYPRAVYRIVEQATKREITPTPPIVYVPKYRHINELDWAFVRYQNGRGLTTAKGLNADVCAYSAHHYAFDTVSRYVGGSSDYRLGIATYQDGKELSFAEIPEWKRREQCKFVLGSYVPVPWAEEEWFQPKRYEHFAHMSVKERGRIAFTQDEAKGQADRQTAMNPGRYLTRFFSNVIDAKEIERLANQVAVESESYGLKLATTPEECASVYEHGPDSCMGGNRFSWDNHPARVYGGPDLAVAYLGTLARPTARSVVWPERKQYVRVYGDPKLELILQQNGYELNRDLDHARIRMIQHSTCDQGTYVTPYFDFNCSGFDVERHEGDDVFRIRRSGGEIDYCEGTVTVPQPWECDHCGSDIDGDDERTEVRDGEDIENWCSSCINGGDAHADRLHGGYFTGEPVILIRYGREHQTSQHWANRFGIEIDGKLYHRGDVMDCAGCGIKLPSRQAHAEYRASCQPCGDKRAERRDARIAARAVIADNDDSTTRTAAE